MPASHPIARWFRVTESLGQDATIGLADVSQPGTHQDLEWVDIPHADHDGIGLLRRHTQAPIVEEPPNLRASDRPGLGKRIAHLWRDLRYSHRWAVDWKHWNPEIPVVPAEHRRNAVGHLFSTDETNGLRERAAAHNVSLNSLLLWALHRQTVARFTRKGSTYLWTIPINLRSAVAPRSSDRNCSSAIPAELGPVVEPGEVHAKIRRLLGEGWHWGHWDMMQILGRTGRRTLRRLLSSYYDRPGHAWLGTFSNLGTWRTSSADAEAPTARFLRAPVTTAMPIGSVALEWNGRLSLSLHIHPALTTSRRECVDALQDTVETLESA